MTKRSMISRVLCVCLWHCVLSWIWHFGEQLQGVALWLVAYVEIKVSCVTSLWNGWLTYNINYSHDCVKHELRVFGCSEISISCCLHRNNRVRSMILSVLCITFVILCIVLNLTFHGFFCCILSGSQTFCVWRQFETVSLYQLLSWFAWYTSYVYVYSTWL